MLHLYRDDADVVTTKGPDMVASWGSTDPPHIVMALRASIAVPLSAARRPLPFLASDEFSVVGGPRRISTDRLAFSFFFSPCL